MFKPMLATNIKIEDLRIPTMFSTKLEGVRGEFTPSGLHSRPMKRFNNAWLHTHFIDLVRKCEDLGIYMEGEFYNHQKTFSEISSICRRANHEDTGDLDIHIFDAFFPKRPYMGFEERYREICQIIYGMGKPHIRVAIQVKARSHKEIREAYMRALDNQFEGLCFKDPNGTYKHGRSTKNEQKFVRIKPEATFDGKVIEIVERMENLVESLPNELGFLSKKQDKDMKRPTGLAAVAIVECEDFPEPVRVTLSKGLSDFDRQEIWGDRDYYIGKHLEFYGMIISGMDQPRSPRFKSWRTDLD